MSVKMVVLLKNSINLQGGTEVAVSLCFCRTIMCAALNSMREIDSIPRVQASGGRVFFDTIKLIPIPNRTDQL